MPYICLARADLPDGTVQILDLKPSDSNRNLVYDGYGQSRYVNRVQDVIVPFNASGVTIRTIQGLKAYLVDRVEPLPASVGATEWTDANQTAVAAAIVARLDAGQSMTLANVNAAIQATFPTSDFDGAATNSTGVLTELLSVLAGRGYGLPAGATKGPLGAWDATQRGSFTFNVLVNDTEMISGELRPVNVGGDNQAREYKGIRQTVTSGSFLISISQGEIQDFASGVTLWPDSDRIPHFPWAYQGSLTYPTVTGARVVTVYDDDGSILA